VNKSAKNRLFIFLSLFLALVVDSYNFSTNFQFFKPSFTLLVLIYWNMALPDKVGITTSLFFGVLVDLIEGSLLGLHPMLYVLIAYLCQRFFYQFRISPLWQQAFCIFIIALFLKQILALDLLDSEIGKSNLSNLSYFFTSFKYAIFSSVMWPVVFYFCRKYRRRFITN
jgi:rod shape-determining protein MreD